MLVTLRGQKVKNVQTKTTLLGLVDLLKITIFLLNFVGTSFCILWCKKITKFNTHVEKLRHFEKENEVDIACFTKFKALFSYLPVEIAKS